MVDETSPPNTADKTNASAGVALLLAAIGTAGSLCLSLSLGLKACPLCLYQRAFLFSAFAVLVMGFLARPVDRPLAGVLALPPAVAGGGIAVFHVYLESSGILECPAGIFGIGSAPQQSLTLFALLLLTLVLGTLSQGSGKWKLQLPAASIIGVLLALAAVASAPPMPKVPTKAYEQPLDICRPPYRPG